MSLYLDASVLVALFTEDPFASHAHRFLRENASVVTVSDFVPVQEAPTTAAMLANSSSIWMKVPPIMGNLRDMRSTTSVEGVMG